MTPDPGRTPGRTPGEGRYAHPERERRFLVAGPVPHSCDVCLLEDRYLDGLRMRLRRVSVGGTAVAWKLTQKVRRDPADPTTVRLTNVYLDPGEWDLLRALPGTDLTKTRTLLGPWAVDVFGAGLAGLELAEVEVADPAAALEIPRWIGVEVSRDERYAGVSLARATRPPIALD